MDEQRHRAFGEWTTDDRVPDGPPFRLGQLWRERRFGYEVGLETVGDLWRSCYSGRPDEVIHGGVRWIFGVRIVGHPESVRALSSLELRVSWELVANTRAAVQPMLQPVEVVSVLGDVRLAAPVWPDSSFSCPFCRAVVLPRFSPAAAPGCLCPNRQCEAGGATAEQTLAARERKAREHAEYERWERRLASRKPGELEAEIRRRAEERHAQARELSRQGFCATCFLSKGRRIRHRRSDHHWRNVA